MLGPVPKEITLHQQSRVLEIEFDDGAHFRLSFEYLRVYSPSAEVRGHGPGQEVLQSGKKNVDIVALEPVGLYAVLPTFSDGHVSGIYSWECLYELGRDHAVLWSRYLERLQAAGKGREVLAESGSGTPAEHADHQHGHGCKH